MREARRLPEQDGRSADLRPGGPRGAKHTSSLCWSLWTFLLLQVFVFVFPFEN